MFESITWYKEALVLVAVVILVYSLSFSNTYSDLTNTNSIENDAAIDNNFLIKFSSRGGFAWQYLSIIYNSTNNHLISDNQNYDAIIGDIQSQTLTDSELSDQQKETLWNIIEEGNILNLSFKNEKPGCCDLVYYNLVIISMNKINSIQWTSLNYDNNSANRTISPEVTNLVDTLIKYTENSTELYTQSEINDR